MKTLRSFFVLVLLAMAPAALHAQDGGGDGKGVSARQFEKQQAKKKRREKKEVAKEEKRLLKLHYKHQDKATRKRMRRNKRNSDNNGSDTHRDPWIRRLFSH